jgi:CheY-like chemotaxis protein
VLFGGRSVAKIVVADDNSNIQKMVGLALKDLGIDVTAVGNGEAAVRKISELRPDLVLADVFMPVRNGYEVCRYVKDDSSLAHIPVILLVGAFDPLDEQEAQRVGADGVLKKPFVPPDPLISMVKSALMRAGVSLGSTPATEKPAASPKRSGAEILNAAVTSKLPAPAPEKLPEAVPEPLEDFPTIPAPPQVKIPGGAEPLAFGSLLETPEAEEEQALTSKPMIHLAAESKWDEEPVEADEEKEEAEESPLGGWHPAGLDEDLERAAAPSKAGKDWRDEAFRGTAPGGGYSSSHWTPTHERPGNMEAAEADSVAVTTVAAKPVDGPVPFTGDAWAAAMAAGIEEKLAEVKDPTVLLPKPESATQPKEDSTQHPAEVAPSFLQEGTFEVPPAVEEAKTAEPANWAAVPETAWELEAKKASLLASTWDAPKPPSINETQDVPIFAVEQPAAHVEAPAESSAYSAEPLPANEPDVQFEAPVSETPSQPPFEAPESKSWETAWEAPTVAPPAPVAEESPAEVSHFEAQPPAPASVEETVTPNPAQPDMDELVARVLAKMNPDVLQKVTRDILRPVIEAIVRDEISSKKS